MPHVATAGGESLGRDADISGRLRLQPVFIDDGY